MDELVVEVDGVLVAAEPGPMIGQRIVSRLIENTTQIKLDRADQRAAVRAA